MPNFRKYIPDISGTKFYGQVSIKYFHKNSSKIIFISAIQEYIQYIFCVYSIAYARSIPHIDIDMLYSVTMRDRSPSVLNGSVIDVSNVAAFMDVWVSMRVRINIWLHVYLGLPKRVQSSIWLFHVKNKSYVKFSMCVELYIVVL